MSNAIQAQSGAITAPITAAEVQDFLTWEAELLDEWRLDEWLQLFEPGARYLIPPINMPEGDRRRTLYLVADDWGRLQARVRQLNGRTVWAENPISDTCRLVSNVRVIEQDGPVIRIAANFTVWRIHADGRDAFFGRYRHTLVRDESGRFRFRERRTILKGEPLMPQGRLAFIL